MKGLKAHFERFCKNIFKATKRELRPNGNVYNELNFSVLRKGGAAFLHSFTTCFIPFFNSKSRIYSSKKIIECGRRELCRFLTFAGCGVFILKDFPICICCFTA